MKYSICLGLLGVVVRLVPREKIEYSLDYKESSLLPRTRIVENHFLFINVNRLRNTAHPSPWGVILPR